jgi:DNA polymerase-4
MPASTAHKLCPHGIFVRGRYEAYKEATEQIFNIFRDFTDKMQPVSLDEAYLDVTVNKLNIPSATIIAQKIRERIRKEVRLTASAGVSYNKFLAKLASDMNKPDGLCVITPDKAIEVLSKLPIKKFHGIGKATASNMKRYGIHTGADLLQKSLPWLMDTFGKIGFHYYYLVRGIDNREVAVSHTRKSIGKESTFHHDIGDLATLFSHVERIVKKLHTKIVEEQIKVKTITLKLRYSNFETLTRSKSLRDYVDDYGIILKESRRLLIDSYDTNRKVRLIGVSLTSLKHSNSGVWEQLIIDWKVE